MEKETLNLDDQNMEKLKEDSLEKYMHHDQDFPDMTSTVSSWECTGMFPRKPENLEEYENLQEMYGMEIPKLRNVRKERE
jgi:hypothetical protein